MESDQVKDKIIKESIALFLNYGIRSVTMDDIARHLGMSKKTIYHHFKDKEEMILLASSWYFENEHKTMEAVEKESENAVDHLYKLTGCLRDQLGNTNTSVLYDLKKYYKRAWENYLKYKYEVIFKSVIRNLERGISEGLFRDDINPEILAYLRIGSIEMSFNPELFPEDKFSLVEIHEQIFNNFTYGILSEKGVKLFETYKQKEVK
jgi:AcrR family transcriptional regulator